MNPDTPQLREQLLAAAADTGPCPRTTDELAALMPPRLSYVRAPLCRSGHDPQSEFWSRGVEMALCTGREHVLRVPRAGADIYPHLRALERQGQLLRIKVENEYAVRWAFLDTADHRAAELAALEAMWSR